MKNLNRIWSLAFIFFSLFIGCERTAVDMITNGDYKFWYKYQSTWPFPFFYYYDVNGVWKVFEMDGPFGFREYSVDDDILYEHWKLIDDSTMEENSLIFKIKYISTDTMIQQTPAGTYDTLYAAPDSMIPKEFRHRW